MAKNEVLDGDYKGKSIVRSGKYAAISKMIGEVRLDTDHVSAYELVTEDVRKSAASGAARGLVAGALLGPVGLLAGGISGKNKGTYRVVVEFKDGKKSLLEVDEKIYGLIVDNLALVKYQEPAPTPTPTEVVAAMNDDSRKPPESLYEQQHRDQIQFQAQNQSQPQYQPQPQQNQALSAADEILKYKQLLDDGVITKKEFEKKKKQLLKK